MAKKRTGLQSEIAGIFSGVPVPKKGGQRSKPGGPSQNPDDPASKTSGPVMPKPVAPQPVTHKPIAPVRPMPQQKVEPISVTSGPKVSEQKIRQPTRKASKRRKDKVFVPKAGVSSSRQKTGILLFIVFSTALIIVLSRPYLTSRRNQATSQTTEKTSPGSSTRANIEIDWPMPPVYSVNLRDPMELGSRKQIKVETTGGIVVRGISYSEDRKYAVVGTNTVQEGDIVPGTKIRVRRINPNNVEFEEDGKTWTQEVEGGKK